MESSCLAWRFILHVTSHGKEAWPERAGDFQDTDGLGQDLPRYSKPIRQWILSPHNLVLIPYDNPNIYIYANPPPRTNLSVFQNSKIPKKSSQFFWKFQNSKIPKFQNSKIPKFQNSKIPKKIQSIFWNSNSQFPFGILEFWNFGISEFWNFGILEFPKN